MAHQSDARLLVLHALRLKGFADTDAVAALSGVDDAALASHLGALQDAALVARRDGRISGWSLTPTGRKEHERLLADEVDAAGCRDRVERAYREFVALNGDLLAICTDWQLRTVDGAQVVNDHSDAAHDGAVITRLVGLHDRVRPVTSALRECFERFGSYGTRLRTALEKVVEGDRDWFTKPVIDSYHTVWFELHEDLLATLGIERATEGER
jgi:hypothetical protein